MYDLASLAEPLVFSLVRRKSEIIYTSHVTSDELEISASIANKEYFLVIHIKYFLARNKIFHTTCYSHDLIHECQPIKLKILLDDGSRRITYNSRFTDQPFHALSL